MPAMTKPPRWLADFFDDVLEIVDLEYQNMAVGYCFRVHPGKKRRCWHMAVFPTWLEVSENGPADGKRFRSGLAVCVTSLLRIFDDERVHVDWVAPARYHGKLDGPHLVCRGYVRGHRVQLKVFDRAPPDYPVKTVFEKAGGTCRPKEETPG